METQVGEDPDWYLIRACVSATLLRFPLDNNLHQVRIKPTTNETYSTGRNRCEHLHSETAFKIGGFTSKKGYRG